MNSLTTSNFRLRTAEEVFRQLMKKEPLFILDVRNEQDYEDWRIEGEQVTSINVPYFDLLDGVESILDRLPSAGPILVVCAKEGSASYVAEQIIEAGRDDVFTLHGGMQAWSEYLHPVKIGGLPHGAIYQFVRPGKGCLSYMILSNGEAAVVDAMRMIEPYERFAQERGVRIKYTLDTHLHADHISGGRRLAEKTGATYWLPPKDAEEVTFSYHALTDGHDLIVGDAKVSVHPIYSPGHTIGSTSLIVDEKYMMTGDILFVESIGRPDLAGKAGDWAGDLRNTLYHTYKKLSQDLIVLPAHYGQSREMNEHGQVCAKLGDLYRVNEGLQVEDEETFRTMVTDHLPPQPNAFQDIRMVNMGKLDPNEDEQRAMEIGPNRCAVHG